MKVFKFGGASVKDAGSVENVARIINQYEDKLVVVISAMGKTTNALEGLIRAFFKNEKDKFEVFEGIKDYHTTICRELFNGEVPGEISRTLDDLNNKLGHPPSLDFNYEYDQIICYGELLSTLIVSHYLNTAGISNQWVDIRSCLRTDDKFRDASVDWELTGELVPQVFHFNTERLYVTQGFIGATPSNLTTSLGREGSDFTAAIIGNILDAENVSIWKDVPGVLNGDPKKMDNTVKINELSYREAIELSYSGAQVIHPKTMKPLHNKEIPLLVKSFFSPGDPGTVIHSVDHQLRLQPVFIIKENQVLITISPRDFSFISIDDINRVVQYLTENRVKVNLIQQSAIDFNLVADEPEANLDRLLNAFTKDYIAHYNTGLTLHTIRYYNDEELKRIKKNRKVYLEQNSRRTARVLVR